MARGRTTADWEIREAFQHFSEGLKMHQVAEKMQRSLNWVKRAKKLLNGELPVIGERYHFEYVHKLNIPPEVLADRDRRAALEYSTVTAAFCGDPIEKHGR